MGVLYLIMSLRGMKMSVRMAAAHSMPHGLLELACLILAGLWDF